MNFEDLQKAWQSQDQGPKVVIDAGALLKEVRRNQQHFRATIFWRDVREVGVAFFLAFYFVRFGYNRDWTDLLLSAACFGIGAFMLVDRVRQRRMGPKASEALKACLESSHSEVGHQIWLLRNVGWWYLLPLAAAFTVSISDTLLHTGAMRSLGGLWWSGYLIFGVLLFWGIYRLNQTAIRKSLQPRLQELEALLTELE